MEALQEEVVASLKRMQEFDPKNLIRETDLGTAKAFHGVVEPAQRLIDLYRRLSPVALQDFPDGQLNQVKSRANADYQLFQQIAQFDVDKTTADRDALVTAVVNAYEPSFSALHPLIAYSLHRAADFQRLDSEARATLQSINDHAANLTTELEAAQAEANRILAEVRATAAEAGVSQQAFHFKEAADTHETDASTWRTTTNRLAWATGLYAFASLFFHQIPWLNPANAYDAAQIAVSKVLVFAVLSFLLILSARNFLAHKHNSVVNRHRQQALQTYQALVDAAMDSANRDIVLNQAASCIFGPQPTGYSANAPSTAPSAKSVVEFLSAGISKTTP